MEITSYFYPFSYYNFIDEKMIKKHWSILFQIAFSVLLHNLSSSTCAFSSYDRDFFCCCLTKVMVLNWEVKLRNTSDASISDVIYFSMLYVYMQQNLSAVCCMDTKIKYRFCRWYTTGVEHSILGWAIDSESGVFVFSSSSNSSNAVVFVFLFCLVLFCFSF